MRLYNDLHLKPVSPRLTLYLAQKGDSEFHPVMLQEVTVSELLKNISDIVEVNNDDSVVSTRAASMCWICD